MTTVFVRSRETASCRAAGACCAPQASHKAHRHALAAPSTWGDRVGRGSGAEVQGPFGCPFRFSVGAALGNLLRDPNWLLGSGFCRSRCWLGYHNRIGNRLRNIDVPSRVDEPESRATSLIEQAGLPDNLIAIVLKQRLHFL